MSRRERLSAWLDERAGHKELLKHLLDEPIVGGAQWAYVFGSALTVVFTVQMVTGVLLMSAYAPSAETAWASVHYITFKMPGGWIVRGLHHFGSQSMVVLLGMHIAQVAIYGAYKRPRELNWWFGLLLLAVTLGFALTGYLLPWDQKGYWATQVATNIAGTTPVFGPQIQQALQGGPSYGNLTLTRFYSLHVAVLPASLVALLAIHIALFRKHGVTPKANADRSRVDAFFPKQLVMDLGAGTLVLLVMFALAFNEHGAPLDAPADPASDYPARPEWYFLPLFELLKYFHGPLEMVGTMGIPLIVGAYLFALPLLDTHPTTSLRPRLKLLAPLALGGLGIVLLTWSALRADATDARFQKERQKANERAAIATALARNGVPVEGPLWMLEHDPTLRGEKLFRAKCASCHMLGSIGDPKEASAPRLDGWGGEAWVRSMLHDPDADDRFGRTALKGEMPSMDVAKPDAPAGWKPMPENEKTAVAQFLAQSKGDAAVLALGEKIVSERCTACHLYRGAGDDGGEEIAPELFGWGTVEWVRSQIADPSSPKTYRKKALDPARKGHMPKFSGDLSESDIDTLASWVYKKADRSATEPSHTK